MGLFDIMKDVRVCTYNQHVPDRRLRKLVDVRRDVPRL
jgi:hypothetical protein